MDSIVTLLMHGYSVTINSPLGPPFDTYMVTVFNGRYNSRYSISKQDWLESESQASLLEFACETVLTRLRVARVID